MKKLLKVILPPFIGFLLFFLAVRYSSIYFTLKIDQIGEGNLRSFMAYYRYVLPLLFAIAFLTQLLVIMPLWNKVLKKPLANRINATIDLFCVCVLFAFGISYAIWDKQDGLQHFVKLFEFMTGVQLAYWLIDLLILFLIE